MGEGETAKHLKMFGYERDTSLFLEMLKNRKMALVTEATSAAFMTAVSIPSIFNAIPKPNGLELINQGNTNLFRLAKNQEFKTYWLTA